ncbi:hypothetical protein Salat_2391700 [Sesamum alatum]|uniref:Uncharacterized protein n=1 Tax=Sesamum alatum TaxID=300844 RepID=A0AAE1XYF0_9LAMI|nr:hypothetical protein Salat_2391700 [Sesamum alatum]
MLPCRKEEKQRSGGGTEYIQEGESNLGMVLQAEECPGGLKAGRGKYRIVGGKIPCGGKDYGAGLGLGRESPPPRVWKGGRDGFSMAPTGWTRWFIMFGVGKMSGRV